VTASARLGIVDSAGGLTRLRMQLARYSTGAQFVRPVLGPLPLPPWSKESVNPCFPFSHPRFPHLSTGQTASRDPALRMGTHLPVPYRPNAGMARTSRTRHTGLGMPSAVSKHQNFSPWATSDHAPDGTLGINEGGSANVATLLGAVSVPIPGGLYRSLSGPRVSGSGWEAGQPRRPVGPVRHGLV
jgi:hypothetical protein